MVKKRNGFLLDFNILKVTSSVPTAHREKKNKLHMIDRNDFRVYYSLRNKEEFLNENASRMVSERRGRMRKKEKVRDIDFLFVKITSNSKILLVYSSAESAEDLEQERAKFKLLSENHHVWSYGKFRSPHSLHASSSISQSKTKKNSVCRLDSSKHGWKV